VATASAVRKNMKKTAIILLSIVLLASCGDQTPKKNIIKTIDGLVKTKYFSIKIPQTWRVATSSTTEIRDGYYPKDTLKLIQSFQTYAPDIYEKNLEIGIYENIYKTFDDYKNVIMNLIPGLHKKEDKDYPLGGLKLLKITPNQGPGRKPQYFICMTEKYLVHIVTQDTWPDLDAVIASLNFTNPGNWKDEDVSDAETSSGAFLLIGGKYDTALAKCELPEGWKVKAETDTSVLFMSSDEEHPSSLDCFLYPFGTNATPLKELAQKMGSMMTKPVIEDVTFGNNKYVKLSDPSDGTNRCIFFALAKDKVYSFRALSPTPELGKEKEKILETFQIK
jgi:hypothetical protein